MITFGIDTVAIIRNLEQSFNIFDAYSSDLHGMSHLFGKCTLHAFEGIEDLVSYLQISCLQIGVVFIRDTELDLQIAHKSLKKLNIPVPFSDKRHQTQPI